MPNSKNKKDKVLVTGGGGYIGTITVGQLLLHGYKVKVLDTFYWGKDSLLGLKNKIELIQEDIRSVNDKILKDVKHVIHTAGLSNDPMANFNRKANYEINTKATKTFAKLCRKHGVNKFIFASSASIYDSPNLENSVKNEDFSVSPKTPYSSSKFEAEKEILKLKNKEFCPVIFRQGTVYGYSPRMRFDLVVNTMVKDALLTKKILIFCQGKQWRPIVDVKDVARAYIQALKFPEEPIRGQVFNLLYGNYQVLEIAKIVKKTLKESFGISTELKFDNSKKHDRSYRISDLKLKKIFNWGPEISVADSVKDMVKNLEGFTARDFYHPRYYNIEWMIILTEVSKTLWHLKRIF